MIIIKFKDKLTNEQKAKVKEDIKKQLKSGIVVYDDSVEITFVDDFCHKCFSRNAKPVAVRINGETVVKEVCRRCHNEVK